MAARSQRPVNVGRLFHWAAEQGRPTVMHLDRPFDIAPDSGTRFDVSALAATVEDAAGWLHGAGLRHGDRLAIVKENHYDFILLASAAARLGALPVMIAPIRSEAHIRTLLTRVSPKVLVMGTTVLERMTAAGIALDDPGMTLVAVGEDRPGVPDGTLRIDDVRGGARPPVRFRGVHEPMLVTHTSGTTGVPKLVVHSPATTLAAVPFRIESYRLPLMTSRPGDVVASGISFAHNRNLSWTNGTLFRGPKKMVILSEPGLDNVARMLAAHPPTSLEACPNVFQYWEELADTRPELFAGVRRFISTFDAVHPRTVRKFLGASRVRLPLWAWGVGQSEIAGIAAGVATRSMVRPGRPRAHDATNVGFPPLVRVKVVDPETGRKRSRGKPGLLMVRTKSRCLTYLGEDDRHRAKDQGRWWNTGDLGEYAGYGRIRLIDREVDMIPGMSCIELESTLLDRLDRASEVIVLGVPGQLPIPVLCMRDDALDPQEWDRACRGLPEMDKPRLVPWDEMPRTATWKVRRGELREQLLGSSDTYGTGQWT
ncbi:class I adenylate-forming enzyme family protein [Streptomyces malaysiensis]|nr:class I adenylate-forming enzyme family protein [Streptomyces autolyticus]